MLYKKLFVTLITLFFCFQNVAAMVFSDVDLTHKNIDAIEEMTKQGIINGYDDGTFKPENPVTRAELCVIISRALGYKKNSGEFKETLPFSDVPSEYWALDYIKFAYDMGIINGMGDGTFLPAGKVTYEQAVKMLVCTANLENEAKKYPGEKWYSGYLEAASKYGILKNVAVEVTKSASRADIVQMMYNSISKDLIVKKEKEPEILPDKVEDEDINSNDELENEVVEEEFEIEYKEVKTIVIDPGHNYSGFDKGARSADETIIEEIITWQISDKLKDFLEDLGFKVYMTRKTKRSSIGDTSVTDSLKARVDFAHEREADLFISVHCNTGGGTGVETYCYDLDGSGADIAKAISKEISKSVDLYNRGAKESNFYVIKNTLMPAILIETGFIDNETDAEILTSSSGQRKIAKAIANAIDSNKIIEIKKKKLKEITEDMILNDAEEGIENDI